MHSLLNAINQVQYEDDDNGDGNPPSPSYKKYNFSQFSRAPAILLHQNAIF